MTNQEILGDLGEIFYQSRFGGTLSNYKYDSEKDLVDVNGDEVEIKTQSRHPNGSFTVNVKHTTNLRKCLNVKKLVFVEYSNSDTIIVHECTNRKYYTTTTRDGRTMACFDIEEMTIIDKVALPKLAKLMRYHSSSKTLKWIE